jgi:hypothetical protein
MAALAMPDMVEQEAASEPLEAQAQTGMRATVQEVALEKALRLERHPLQETAVSTEAAAVVVQVVEVQEDTVPKASSVSPTRL